LILINGSSKPFRWESRMVHTVGAIDYLIGKPVFFSCMHWLVSETKAIFLFREA